MKVIPSGAVRRFAQLFENTAAQRRSEISLKIAISPGIPTRPAAEIRNLPSALQKQ